MAKKMIFALLMIAVLCGAAMASREAVCVIRVEADAEFLELGDDALDTILYSPAVAGEAFKTALGKEVEYEAINDCLDLDYRDTGEQKQSCVCDLDIELSDGMEPVAEAILNEVYAQLKSQLTEAYESYMTYKRACLEKFGENVAIAREEAKLINKQMAEFVMANPMPVDDISDVIVDINADIEDIVSDLQIKDVYLRELTNQRAQAEIDLENGVSNDIIANKMEEMVEVEKVKVERAKKMLETGLSAEIEGAEKDLLKAQVELAKHRENQQDKYQNKISSLTSQIAKQTMDNAMERAELQSLKEKLAKTHTLLESSGEYKMLKYQQEMAEDNLRRTMKAYYELKRSIDNMSPPVIMVIGL